MIWAAWVTAIAGLVTALGNVWRYQRHACHDNERFAEVNGKLNGGR